MQILAPDPDLPNQNLQVNTSEYGFSKTSSGHQDILCGLEFGNPWTKQVGETKPLEMSHCDEDLSEYSPQASSHSCL